MAVTTARAGNSGQRIVPIPGMPGEFIDARILPDVEALIRHFKVKITDGYARSGHAAGGEHPHGLAIDFVPDPRRGGTWDDVDRAVKFARGLPKTFRWIGYDGVPGHGRGHHAHFSWHGKGGTPNPFTAGKVIIGSDPNPDGKSEPELERALKSPAAGVAGEVVEALLNMLKGLLGDAAKPLLYVALVGGGAALAFVGISRAAGLRAPKGQA